MDPNFFITAFVALFVVIDPIGLAPLFVALTAGMSRAKRRSIAVRAVLTAAGILLVLFLTALDMLFERRQKRRENKAEEDDSHEDDPSIFPLAIPLIAGPGAIATLILLTGDTNTMMFLGASPLERLLGKTGIDVVTRLLGMLLAALSVQFVLDGLRGFGLGS